MPIYEFLCKKCGHRFELMLKMTEAQPTDCPECGEKGSVDQLLSPPAVQFKGSGWYVTDYGRKGASSPSKGDTKTDVKAESGSSEKKTETKSDSSSSKPDKS